MRKALKIAVPLAVAALPLLIPSAASAQSATGYQATLKPLNHSSGSGSAMVMLNGNEATVTEHVSGLAGMFAKAPYPHVQHIHINGQGVCPTMAADKNGDGVVSTTEGAPSYGPIGTTLSTSGGTTPADGTNIKIAPSGAGYSYSRTITLDSATMSSLTSGKAVIVVHGLDPATLSKQAQGEKSDLVPSLPLAATSPTLCGALTASQMTNMPAGAANTGGGSTAGTEDTTEIALGGIALVSAAGLGVFAYRRRTGTQS
jgi:hypothetical protein